MKPINHISLKKLVTENKVYLLLGVLLLILNKGATMVIPYTSKLLIDDVIKNNNTVLLKWIVLVIVVSLLIQAISSFALVQILGVKAQEKIAEIRTFFFNKLTRLPLNHFTKTGSGELVSRTLNDFESIRVFLGAGFVQLIGGLISVLFALTLMFMLNYLLAIYILIPVLLFCLVIYFIYKKQKPAFKNRKAIRAGVSADLIEAYRNMKVLKGFGSNQYATDMMQSGFYRLYESIKTTLTATNLIISLGIIFIGLTSVMIIWFGGNMAINQEITIGELTTFTIYLAFMIAPIYQITKISSQLTDASASIERINETLELKEEQGNSKGFKNDITGHIVFENVSFSYAEQEILSNISFDIAPNTVNAIVGKSGAGKTTLTDLIAGFYGPDSGKITLDGQAISEYNLAHYRSNLGFVFQETLLFSGSIKENILLAKPNASDQELSMAIERANIPEFISQMSKGIHSEIGEGGNNLSEGQKQRIAIARAFLADPKILILDEATSNLDATNEKLINDSIKKLMQGRTIIIIAHRLETIQDVDQIIVLDAGQMVEKGTHQDLMDNRGKYYNLFNTYS